MNPSLALPAAIVVLLLLALICYKFLLRIFGVVIIPGDSVGVVYKKYVLVGSHRTLPDGAIIALQGEAGYQADTLAPGVHFGLWPWQYQISAVKFITIRENCIGVVEARDGTPLPSGRVLAKSTPCDAFQNARAFLNGGERGPQLQVIPPGTYRINTSLFTVREEKATEIEDNTIGILTTREGAPLPSGEIAGHEIEGHNLFQDAQTFIDRGGFKGVQEQVLNAGRYFLNPLFATVEIVEMTEVPIAHVGVVIAYVGQPGVDVTGDNFKHGNLVRRGQKGVWIEPLDPGKYPINPRTHKVEVVPTANVVLNWADGKSEAHKLDENLSTITVRSSDGFKFNLDVAQIIHIPRDDAPKVIARFGSMLNLVTQVLEPTIGNYFRNAAQGSDVIDFLKNRSTRQDDAKLRIGAALTEYNVGAVDTLIGDIVPPDELMKTLTDRKVAEVAKVTYETQKIAEDARKELAQAKAMADTQPTVVTAERSVQVADFTAQAAVKTADGQARSKKLNAEADAMVVKTVGDAEASKTLAIGTAEADVIKMKISSMEADKYAVVQVAQALAQNGIKLVPDINVTGAGSGAGAGLVDVLLGNLLLDQRRKMAENPVRPESSAGK